MLTNVLEYLEHSAQIFPDKCAFADENRTVSFGCLLEMAKRIGSSLAGQIEESRKPVVVFMDKSPLDIVAFMGILYSGCFYVPMDTAMPVARIRLITENLEPSVILTESRNLEAAKICFPQTAILQFEELIKGDICEERLQGIRRQALDTDPVYVLYTSGSTGVPKGVVVPHRSLIDYMEHFCEEIQITDSDIIANQAPFYFDASLIDIYSTLKMGATTVIVPLAHFSMPLKLLQFLEEWNVTTIRWVPSALNMVSTFRALKTLCPEKLRKIIFGAESMPTKCYNYWHKYYPNAVFVQIYGPTEITGVCTYYIVDREYEDTQTIPIGKAFQNSDVFLLDETNHLITKEQTGRIGEMCVRGTCLSHGYYRSFERTDEVFVQNPLNSCYEEKIYRTGDLASYNEYGEFVFASRKDFQVKHMGHRIELGEVEAAVVALEEIKAACCLFDSKKGRIILVYCSAVYEDADVINALKDKLPRYMIPNVLYKIDEMPLTLSGKADRVKLKETYVKE